MRVVFCRMACALLIQSLCMGHLRHQLHTKCTAHTGNGVKAGLCIGAKTKLPQIDQLHLSWHKYSRTDAEKLTQLTSHSGSDFSLATKNS